MPVTITAFCKAFMSAADNFSSCQPQNQGLLRGIQFVNWAKYGINPEVQVRSATNGTGFISVFPKSLDQRRIVANTITSLGISFEAARKLCTANKLGALAQLIQEAEKHQTLATHLYPSPRHAQRW